MHPNRPLRSACIHCQKAHLTCDDSRPCQRCVRRGMANTCTEGHRKKAKYLLDEDELGEFGPPTRFPGPHWYAAALKKSKEKEKEAAEGKAPPPQALSSAAGKTPLSLRSQDPPTYSTNSQYPQGFGSEVANMEYSMLSAILGDQAHDDATLPNPPPRVNGHPLDLHSHRLVVGSDFGSLTSEQRWPSRELPPPQTPTGALAPPQQQNSHPNPMYGQSGSVDVPMFGPDARGAPMPGPSMYPSLPQPDTSPLSSQPPPTASSFLPPPPISSHPSGQVAVSTNLPSDSVGTQLHGQQVAAASTSHASNIYGTVTAPYDYTKVFHTPSYSPCQKSDPDDCLQGYHYLMQYLRLHFDQDDILRVVRALAIYRPSLIALQVPMSIEDETFAEKSLQRSLIVRLTPTHSILSFNLMSFSGSRNSKSSSRTAARQPPFGVVRGRYA